MRTLVFADAFDEVVKFDVFEAVEKFAYFLRIWTAVLFWGVNVAFFGLVRDFEHFVYYIQVDKHFA